MLHNNYRTVLPLPSYPFRIQHAQKGLLLGSCFAENIGSLLQKGKFDVCLNPFGIQYNPLSIGEGLTLLLSKSDVQQSDLVFHNDLWHSWSHHGSFSSPTPEQTLANIHTAYQVASTQLQHLDYLTITFGTAGYFTLRSTNQTVSNCHKFPASLFNRQRATPAQITTLWIPLIQQLISAKPQVKIIFSVSPVKYLRDGYIENQRSKATLILAVEELVQQFPDHCVYFPAYELVTDDLRDYRFFADDMMHPSELAINYVWDCFSSCFFDAPTQQLNNQIFALYTAKAHRPINLHSPQHRQFLDTYYQKTLALQNAYPALSFNDLLTYFGEMP